MSGKHRPIVTGCAGFISSHLPRGDVLRTAADASLARRDLDWRPTVGLLEGLANELAWVASRIDVGAPA